jgi:iron complex transport system substrate-binding protein
MIHGKSIINQKVAIIILIIAISFTVECNAGSFPVTVKDSDGFEIIIRRQPERIISLAASITEILYSLGLGENIIALTEESTWPPETAKVEKVGSMFLNYERVVAMRPDIIFVESSLRPREAAYFRKLKMNIIAVQTPDYHSLLKAINMIGKATGKQEEAQREIKYLNDRMNEIEIKVENIPKAQRPEVFIEIWNSPLITAGSDTFVNFMVNHAGGINLTKDMKKYPQINPETLLARDPDVIILSSCTREQFLSNRLWRNLKAVRNERVHEINPDIFVRPTLRSYEGVRKLYHWFYPNCISSEKSR